jgi:hypothetical protein
VLPPDTPALYAIENADGDGNYTVTWSAAERATGYLLQESTYSNFWIAVTVVMTPKNWTGAIVNVQ